MHSHEKKRPQKRYGRKKRKMRKINNEDSHVGKIRQLTGDQETIT